MTLKHLRSSAANKRPQASGMAEGQLAINTASGSPGLFFKDSASNLVKVGPVHVGSGAPNASPASGGTSGNSLGEQWLDTSGGTYVFKIWDGSAWRSEAGEFVNTTGDTMTGALGIVTGSASTPGLFFSGDANSGLYSPGADQVAISTNGTGRLFVDASGNVGVGTSSPSQSWTGGSATAQQLRGLSGQITVFRINEAGGTFGDLQLVSSSASEVGIYNFANGVMRFGTNSTERMRLDSSGRLGLGTSAPTHTLHVANGSAEGANTVAMFRGGGSSTGNGAQIILSPDSAGTYSTWLGAGIANSFDGASWGSSLVFKVNKNASATDLQEVGRFDSSGRLGVGTTSPNTKLQVDSPVSLSGSGNDYYFLAGNTSSASRRSVALGVDGVGGNAVIAGYNTFSPGYGSLLVDGSDLQFRISGTERARIDSSGRLGLGTSSPSATTKMSIVDSTSAGIYLLRTAQGETVIENTGPLTIRQSSGNGSNQNIFFKTGASVGTEVTAMTIDGSQRVGIGTTSPGQSLHVVGLIQADSSGNYLQLQQATNDSYINNTGSGGIIFRQGTGFTERARIDSSGRLLVGTSSTASAGGVSAQHAFSHSTSSQWAAQVQHTTAAGNTPFGLAIKYTAATPNGTSSDFIFCEDATAIRARIYSNGGLANYSANNVNLSDRNVKKDITPADDTWGCLKEWQIVNFRYKDQPDDADLNMGVIAQQVAESCPEVITVFQEAKEAKEAVLDEEGNELEPAQEAQPEKLGVKDQQMMWMAIKALQEAQLRIETLEAKVAALEAL